MHGDDGMDPGVPLTLDVGIDESSRGAIVAGQKPDSLCRIYELEIVPPRQSGSPYGETRRVEVVHVFSNGILSLPMPDETAGMCHDSTVALDEVFKIPSGGAPADIKLRDLV